MKRLYTCLISMAVSRSNKLWNKAEIEMYNVSILCPFQFKKYFGNILNFLKKIRESIKTL